MGSVYRPKYTDRYGQVRESPVWCIQYYSHGNKVRESAKTTDWSEAKEILKRREGEATKGRATVSSERKVLFSELAKLVETDYEINEFNTADDIELRHRLHILPFFGKMKAIRIGEADLDRYVHHRKAEGASNATINRELATIKRAFNLGIQKKYVSDRPHIAMLEEDNVRQGFFEPDQFQSVLVHLPERLKPVARFAYVTGWRKSEILSIQWRQVDFKAGIVRLEPGTTKNREARQFPFTDELRAVLTEQREKADVLRKKGKLTPWVFFYPMGKSLKRVPKRAGRRFEDFKKAWKTACAEAGIPDRLVHDFRRTSVRNLNRAGVPERVAMKLTGHKTRSIFDRYNIVSEADMFDAADSLDNFLSQNTGKDTGKVGRFGKNSKPVSG